MKLQDKKATQNDPMPVTPSIHTQPAYTPPTVTVYEEEELLKTVAVLGCSPF